MLSVLKYIFKHVFIARKDTHFYITNPTVNYYLDTTNPIIYSRQTSDEELFMTAITGLHRILLDFTGFYWILLDFSHNR